VPAGDAGEERVRAAQLRPYAALPALILCCLLTLLSGCTFYNSLFHRSHDHGCRDKPFEGNTEDRPGLKVPEGMTPPDPRNQVKIPQLSEPERIRAKTEPCMAQPPSYASGASIALPTRSGAPMGAPAPAPVPVLPVNPTDPLSPPASDALPIPATPTPAPVPTPEPAAQPVSPAPSSPPPPATPQPPATPAPPEASGPDSPK